MPELLHLASLDLGCPEELLSWNCVDACIEDDWPAGNTTIVVGCDHEVIYKFRLGRWRMTTFDGVERW